VGRFRNYAVQNAESWYRYANETRHRDAENGSLYLVTGFDKARYWGVASFSNVPTNFGMTFSSRARSGASITNPYCWQDTGYAATRLGPNPIESFDGAESPPRNQCAFIRGFKISLSWGLWASMLGQTASVSSITDMTSRDILSRHRFVPFSGTGSRFGRFFSNLVGRGTGNQRVSKGPASESAVAIPPGDQNVVVVSDPQPSSHVSSTPLTARLT
jgi:hypothetical protein